MRRTTPIPNLPLAVLLVGAIVSLYPILALAPYAYPSADDYCLAVEARKGFWQMQEYFYLSWTGRYTATFLQTLLSHWDLATIYPWFCLATIEGTWLAFRVLAASVWREGSSIELAVAASVATSVFVAKLPSSAEAFFWLTSAITYQWGLIAYVAWLGLLIRVADDPPGMTRWRPALAILTMALPGFNEVTSVLMLMSLVAITMVIWQRRRRMDRFVLLLLLVALAATAVSLLAPGNVVRSLTYPENPTRHSLAFATIETFRQMGRFIGNFGPHLGLWVAAGAAWWWRRVSNSSTNAASRWASGPMLLLGAATVYLTLFPLYWEYGDHNYTGEGRTYNITYFALCILVFLGVDALLSRVEARWGAIGRRVRARNRSLGFALAIILALLMVSSQGTVQAIRALRQAPEYLAAQRARDRILREPDSEGDIVVVDEILVKPAGLFWGDIQPSETHWINSCLASYYGISAVRTRDVLH